jgi:hypothetical protein
MDMGTEDTTIKTILMEPITFWHYKNPVLWGLSYLER